MAINLYDARLESLKQGRAEILARVAAKRKRAEQQVERAKPVERGLANLKAQLEKLKRLE